MANEKKTTERSEFGEHMKAAGSAMVRQWKSLIPADFWDYGREARRETLLAVRSLIDRAIDRLESSEESGSRSGSSRRKTRVEVEKGE